MLDKLPLELLSLVVDYLDNTLLWRVSKNIRTILAKYRTPVLYLYDPTFTSHIPLEWIIRIKLINADKIMSNNTAFCNVVKYMRDDVNIKYYTGHIYKHNTICNGVNMTVMSNRIKLDQFVDGIMKVYPTHTDRFIDIEVNQYSMKSTFKIINRVTREHDADAVPKDIIIKLMRRGIIIENIHLNKWNICTIKMSDYIIHLNSMYPEQHRILNEVDYKIVEDFALTYYADGDNAYIDYLTYCDGSRDTYVGGCTVIPNVVDEFIKYAHNLQEHLAAVCRNLSTK